MSENELRIRSYLREESPIRYDDSTLEATAEDVMALDPDLREYVFHFLESGQKDTDLKCECFSIRDLLDTEQYTPITAALLIQWYRRDPAGAASSVLFCDSITGIPDELPEMEE